MTKAEAVHTRIAGALAVVLLCVLAPAATAAAAVPVNQVAPSVTGVLQEGELLTADPGTWTDSPTSYRYEWFSCGVFPDCGYIAGATQQTYVVDAAQVGRMIGVDVTATNADGDSLDPEASPLYGPIAAGGYPRIVTAPAIAGTPQDGQTLSASPGSWSPAADGYSYQWYGCDTAVTVCEPVAGATAQTYQLGPGDVGRRFGVGVVATNAGGPSDEAFSQPTDVVRAAGTTGTDPTPSPPSSPLSPVPSQPVDETTAPPGSTTPSPFAMVRKLARSNGNLELSVRARRAGRFTARATASAALLARGCVSSCKRTGRADFGSTSLTVSAAGIVKLVIKPNARAARALRRSGRLPLRLTLTFRPAGGGTAISRTYAHTVSGALARGGRTLRPSA